MIYRNPVYIPRPLAAIVAGAFVFKRTTYSICFSEEVHNRLIIYSIPFITKNDPLAHYLIFTQHDSLFLYTPINCMREHGTAR